MKKNISLKDIAAEVGVSASLVSYVLNGHAQKKRVSEEIAEKVRATAEKLNYRPNQIAKSLKTNKSHTIGLIVAEIYYRYTTGITRSIESKAKENGYTVIIGNSHEDLPTLRELINALLNRQVDGLIIVAAENAEKEIEYLKKRDIPFVLIDRHFPEAEANFIGIDNFKVAYQATEYLIKHLRKNIAFINYETSFVHLQQRNEGYLKAIDDYKMNPGKRLLKEIRKSHLQKDMQSIISELTSMSENCDAIFFATDTLAIQGIRHLITQNVSIPEDVAVLSFDESEAFALSQCPITYYRQPLEEIGNRAVELLFDVMKNVTYGKQILLDSTLVAGKSCGEE